MAMASEAANPGRATAISKLQEALQQTLRRLSDIRGVDGAIIASRDGLLVAASGGASERLEVEAAIAAAIFGAIDRAAANIDIGPVRAALVETPTRSLQLLSLAELLLIVVAEKNADMGRVRAGMATAARELTRQAGCR